MVMKHLRKRKVFTIIMWISAVAVIPGFLIWGIGLTGAGRTSSLAATVNRRDITRREFTDRVADTEREYRRVFGEKYDEFVKQLNVEQIVLEGLIREKIYEAEGAKRRVRVGDREVLAAVKRDPVFRDEKGEFSQEKYNAIISQVAPDEEQKIVEDVRKRLFLQRLQEAVVAETTIAVTDGEVDDYLARTPTAKDTDRESIREMLRSQRESAYFHSWYEGLRTRAKITVYLETMKPLQNGGE